MLEVHNLSIRHAPTGHDTPNVQLHSLEASAGSLLGVTGDSGSGKTSLLLAFGGLLKQYSPLVRVQGRIELFGMPLDQESISSHVSLVIDNPYSQSSGLKATCIEEIVLPLEMRGFPRGDMGVSSKFVSAILGIKELLDADIEWLSGGELQRLHLASALISKPRLLLLDQALTELDPPFRSRLLRFLKMYAETSQSIVVVTFSTREISESRFDSVITLAKKTPLDLSRKFNTQTVLQHKVQGNAPVLTVDRLSFAYSRASPVLFQGLSFSLMPGELLFLLGSNGSGKSTLAKLILGVLPSAADVICVKGKPISGYSLDDVGSVVNCAFQNPDHYFCKGSVSAELSFGSHRIPTAPWFASVVDVLGLGPHYDRNPFDLNRGERKRLSIALAARTASSIMFLDEPSQYQDESGVEMVAEAIRVLTQHGVAIICCTHDERVLEKFVGAKVIRLPQPAHPETAERQRMVKVEGGLRMGGISIGNPPSPEHAHNWVMECWRKVEGDWIESMPDVFAYWSSTIYPRLTETLSSLKLLERVNYLDVGCGIGWHTITVSNLIQREAPNLVRGLGVDMQDSMLDYARFFFGHHTQTCFARVDATVVADLERECRANFRGHADLVTSFFVLHDEPNVGELVRSVHACLTVGGYFVSVLLHPEWVEFLKERRLLPLVSPVDGESRRATQLGKCAEQSSWIGMYPVIRELGKPCYLPYFHGTLGYYIDLMKSSGFGVNEPLVLTPCNDGAEILLAASERLFGYENVEEAKALGVYEASVMIVAHKTSDIG